jgi:sigma-B regulation protein RsbU (phosphoserine phosphatase)
MTQAEQYQEIKARLNRQLSWPPQGTVFSISPPVISGVGISGGFTLVLEDRAGRDVQFLAYDLDKFLAAARKRAEIGSITTFLSLVDTSLSKPATSVFHLQKRLSLNLSGLFDAPKTQVSQMVIEEGKQVDRLACLEVRGGNDAATYAVDLPGLAGWVSCQPLRPSLRGGDVYYLSACSQGVITRVALADVSGHGEGVSAVALRLRAALRRHIEQWDQSALIRELNGHFLKNARGGRFATAFLASYYTISGELLFTNAGHPAPLWYRRATRQWDFLRDSTPLNKEIVDLPLGLIAGTEYSQTAIQLDPGDLLLLYTDGISEAYDDSGTQLGEESLLAIARKLPVDSAMAAGKELVAATARFSGNAPPTDDQTVLALQRLAGGVSR